MQKQAKRAGSHHTPPSSGSGKIPKLAQQNRRLFEQPPELKLIYDTAPVGLAFLSLNCHYVQINQRLTEICGISVADHIGRSVRETVPRVADQVEKLVQTIARTDEPITGIEVRGQKADKSNADHVWITNWHPLKTTEGKIVGVNVVAEDLTERKRAEAVLAASEHALRASEARFRELADNISQFAWTADTEGKRNWYNKRWYDYSGTTFDEVQGFGWQKLHHPGHLERVVRHIRESFKSDKPWEDTFPLRGRDGKYRWFLSRALPIRDETGKVVRWFGTNTDITDQLEAEKALRELNETLEERVKVETHERLQIWNVSQDLLLVADLDGKYLNVNPAWTLVLGWSEQDLLGKDSYWLVHTDDREKIRAEAKQLAAGEMTQRFEIRFRHRNGTYRWLLWKAVQDQSCIYAMAADVTELKDAEEKLGRARQELTQVARRVSLATMSAAIAHEIRQPLGAIVTNASAGLRWLNRPQPDLDEVRESLSHIVGDGHRASEVIQSVRAMFTQSEHPGTALDANDLIRETVAMANVDLNASRVVVDLELADELPLITAHKGQLQQVILNIVTNAIDSMRTINDRVRMLRVRSRPFDSNGVAVSVQDSGTGIDPQNVDRIFEAFFSTKTNGMGMGLAICRSIVEAHGGRLSVSAGVPHGSVFHIVLPGVQ